MFHVSRFDLGLLPTLIPFVPTTYAKDECRITPRVCFAPSVGQCIMGIAGFGENPGVTILAAFLEMTNSFKCPTVYYCDEDLFKPPAVSDFHITQEHWSLTPIQVERIGYIDYMAMYKRKEVVVSDHPPTYISDPGSEVLKYISDEDKKSFVRALNMSS